LDVVLGALGETPEGIGSYYIYIYRGELVFYSLIIVLLKLDRHDLGGGLSFPDMDMMEDGFLQQTRGREIDLIVCTDSEAILGNQRSGCRRVGVGSFFSPLTSQNLIIGL
jgi:hypothetical protein